MAQLIVRLLPLVIVGIGIIKGSSIFKDLVGGSFKSNTRTEVETIARLLKADVMMGEKVPAPGVSFARYLERTLTAERKAKKSMAHDYWGTLYALQVIESEVRIVSAGPDKILGNADDIMAKISNVPSDQLPQEEPVTSAEPPDPASPETVAEPAAPALPTSETH